MRSSVTRLSHLPRISHSISASLLAPLSFSQSLYMCVSLCISASPHPHTVHVWTVTRVCRLLRGYLRAGSMRPRAGTSLSESSFVIVGFVIQLMFGYRFVHRCNSVTKISHFGCSFCLFGCLSQSINLSINYLSLCVSLPFTIASYFSCSSRGMFCSNRPIDSGHASLFSPIPLSCEYFPFHYIEIMWRKLTREALGRRGLPLSAHSLQDTDIRCLHRLNLNQLHHDDRVDSSIINRLSCAQCMRLIVHGLSSTHLIVSPRYQCGFPSDSQRKIVWQQYASVG